MQSACGCAGQLVGAADEEVSRVGVAAPLRAHVAVLGEGELVLALLVLLGRDEGPRYNRRGDALEGQPCVRN